MFCHVNEVFFSHTVFLSYSENIIKSTLLAFFLKRIIMQGIILDKFIVHRVVPWNPGPLMVKNQPLTSWIFGSLCLWLWESRLKNQTYFASFMSTKEKDWVQACWHTAGSRKDSTKLRSYCLSRYVPMMMGSRWILWYSDC